METKNDFRIGWDPRIPGRKKTYRRILPNVQLHWSSQAELQTELRKSGCIRVDGELNSATAKRDLKKRFFESVFSLTGDPLDYFEFGVYRGESLSLVADLLNERDARLYGFDSFKGYPEAWQVDGRVHRGREDYLLTDEDRAYLAKQKSRRGVKLIAGYFQNTLPDFLASYDPNARRKVIYINSDLYSSALFLLTAWHPYVRPSDIIVMMLGGPSRKEGEYKAFNDYIHAYMLKEKVKFLVNANDAWHVAFNIFGS